ncbi:MAG: hypothetical protein ACRD2T_14390 [Thermoanaerobaculia bacterium]
MRAPVLLAAALLVSCAGHTQREFTVEAINTSETPVACAIYVDDELQAGKDGRELTTPARVTVRFRRRSDGEGFESVKLGARAVKLDPSGKVIHGLLKGQKSDYNEDFRSIYPTDEKIQLFILARTRG